MRKLRLWSACLCAFLFTSAGMTSSALAQASGANEWAWMAGGNTVGDTIGGNAGQAGVYGTLGAPSAGNIPGGRENAVSWADRSGHFWLFGGFGADAFGIQSYLNDLWELNPATNQWAWVSGSSTVTVAATLTRGHPGVYGTLGVAAAGNVPGAREYAMSWTDGAGNLWLFGGLGFDADGNISVLNDFWEFNPTTALWTWMGGSSVAAGQAGIYGTLGLAAPGNFPGVRTNSVTWTDAAGHFWLFGGSGSDAKGKQGDLNDLWEFNPASNEWTWMGEAVRRAAG